MSDIRQTMGAPVTVHAAFSRDNGGPSDRTGQLGPTWVEGNQQKLSLWPQPTLGKTPGQPPRS